MAGPEGPLREAVDAALQTDKQLDARDKEQAIVAQNIRMIKGLWNPKDPETAETEINRAAVLQSMLEVAVSFNIDHQDIADWIYGKGQVNVESRLKELYSDPKDYSQVSPGSGGKRLLFRDNMPVFVVEGGVDIDPGMRIEVKGGPKEYKTLDIRVTPKDNLHVEIYKFPNGQFGIIMYDLKDRGLAVIRIPNPRFNTFDEAHEAVLERIAALRKLKGYKVDSITEGGRGGVRGGTLPDGGPLDVNPDPSARGEEPEEVELDFSELMEKLRTTRDFKWALGQLEIARRGDVDYDTRRQLIGAVIENKNIAWNNENLLELFDCVYRSIEDRQLLNAVIKKSENPKEFIRYLVWNLQFIAPEGRVSASYVDGFVGTDRVGGEGYNGSIFEPNRKTFIGQFKSFRKSNPERFPGYRRKDHPAGSVFA